VVVTVFKNGKTPRGKKKKRRREKGGNHEATLDGRGNRSGKKKKSRRMGLNEKTTNAFEGKGGPRKKHNEDCGVPHKRPFGVRGKKPSELVASNRRPTNVDTGGRGVQGETVTRNRIRCGVISVVFNKENVLKDRQ